MQREKYIRELLVKFAENKCSEEEYHEVLAYFQSRGSSKNMPSVDEILKMSGDPTTLDNESAERIFQDIINHNHIPQNEKSATVLRLNKMWQYAAAVAVLLLIVVGYGYQKNWFSSVSESTIIVNDLANSELVYSETITLELGNGRVEVINPDGSRTVRDEDGHILGIQDKSRLVYDEVQPIKELVYNTLRIPYGQRFELLLSDGTSVHLNAGTTLKFPVRFPESSETREVFVTGEAYFDVATNESQPFVVNTGEMDVRVLGTKFNVSTYPEDDHTDVVLVEGLVRLDAESEISETTEKQLLKPGYKASFDKREKTITTQAVPTSIYTSWIKGELVFRDMTFEDILKKLERKFNVTIENNNDKLAKERFNASFGDESIEAVLKYLKTIYGIEYSIEDDKVIIK